MAKYFIPFAIYFGTTIDNLYGQSLPAIQLDRPDQTECPFITPKKYIQIENGFTIENFDQNQKSYNYPSTLWKYGINEKFELRLITELVSEKTNGNTNTGLLPITIGFKTSLFEEKGLIPKTSFIGHIATSKIGSKEFQAKYIAPSFRFTMQHTLTEKISLAYNLGAEWNGESAEHSYIYTLTTGFSLTEKIGCYTELYGFLPAENKADHRFDCGLTYLIKNDIMADISGGFGLTENAPKNYISLGLSYRFNTKKQKTTNR
jgi:hypothetical protein